MVVGIRNSRRRPVKATLPWPQRGPTRRATFLGSSGACIPDRACPCRSIDACAAPRHSQPTFPLRWWPSLGT
eukprot:8380075-Pyramimonas_sp.AAC.1